jgi:hypothetical protein
MSSVSYVCMEENDYHSRLVSTQNEDELKHSKSKGTVMRVLNCAAQRGSGGTTPRILYIGTRRADRFTPGTQLPAPTEKWERWTAEPVWTLESGLVGRRAGLDTADRRGGP